MLVVDMIRLVPTDMRYKESVDGALGRGYNGASHEAKGMVQRLACLVPDDLGTDMLLRSSGKPHE